jgi:hypothetical protein
MKATQVRYSYYADVVCFVYGLFPVVATVGVVVEAGVGTAVEQTDDFLVPTLRLYWY